MRKTDYMASLESKLANLPKEERLEFIADYEEHFTIGLTNGRTEDEIAESLGKPEKVAKEIVAQYNLEVAHNHPSMKTILRASFAAISLSMFNLIFVLGPFVAIMVIPITLAMVSIALILSPLLLLIQEGFSSAFWIQGFLLIGYVGLGMILAVGSWKLLQLCYGLIIRYLNFNLNIVRGGQE
ncbi:HAAS signaling domain-containing protein [Geomicrobium sediminis]|uniref:Membrane protein n=1 Tax=Geomicrobium sediminis TaxID=1347788 RepID=A0ABS2PBY1_9BACL|nr:DUF1700 domain-containing protein [Geomicrobium sediminis]MBM7632945.1 putative membrane protein [Geomicrobium sediminis]